jgi:hypothetical protein
VGTVLAGPEYGTAAAALAEEIGALPPATEAVARFEENARHA